MGDRSRMLRVRLYVEWYVDVQSCLQAGLCVAEEYGIVVATLVYWPEVSFCYENNSALQVKIILPYNCCSNRPHIPYYIRHSLLCTYLSLTKSKLWLSTDVFLFVLAGVLVYIKYLVVRLIFCLFHCP